jgi:bifunctional NMN adenylyltransferase/nudix hydrolase
MNEVKKRTAVAAIVGRFQVNELHEAHRELFDTVIKNHDRVIVFLGLAPTRNTRNNPLDFKPRAAMIRQTYPDVEVVYIDDVNNDTIWSKNLDTQIQRWLTPGQDITLYGSRDSFIKHYTGRFPTTELESKTFVSGTDVRNRIINKAGDTPDFRAGMVYAAGIRYPAAMPTVDIAVIDNDKQQVLLGRKPNETKFRFIGGFVDPKKDDTFEQAVQRELREETGGNMEVTTPVYISTRKVDDWRYRGEQDKIFTTFYKVNRVYGNPQPDDDIAELKWFTLEDFIKNSVELVVPEHQGLCEDLIQNITKEK